jgi:hypothetical protein
MSDQGDLGKRWNAPSDDTNAYTPADDAPGPMPGVEPADDYGPAPAWSHSAEPDRARSGQAETWPAGPEETDSAPPEPFEPGEERPLGKLVFPEAPAPEVEDEFSAAASELPARTPRQPRASDYVDYTDTDDAGTDYAATDYAATDYAGTGQAAADYAPTDYAPTDYAPTDYAPTDYAATDYAATDYAATDYAATDYAATDYAGTDRTPLGRHASDYAPSDYPQSDYAPSEYSAPDPGPEFGRPAAGTPDDGRVEAPAASARTDFSAPPAGGWEGSLFDGTADSEQGDGRYAPVMPSGPSTPPKPGTPSSGNLRIPDWMREENGGGSGGRSDEDKSDKDGDDDSGGGSRVALFAGVGLLVLALIASAGVYFLKSKDGSGPAPSTRATTGGRPAAGSQTQNTLPTPPDKELRRFPGTPTRVVGRMADARAGLSYPRFGSPWQMPTKQNKLGQLGWSGQQIVVTEQRGSRLWYGQLLSGTLNPAELSMYAGKGTEQAAAVAFANSIETRFYGFPHKTQPFASQALTVDGHKGWLISSYLRYQRPGVKATGELLVTAVIDTGRKAPAVLFIGIPNTHRKLWADVSYFLSNLHVVR